MTFGEYAGNLSIKELRGFVSEQHNDLLDKEKEIIDFFNEIGINFSEEIGHSLDLRNYTFLTEYNRLAILERIKNLWDVRENAFTYNSSNSKDRAVHEKMCEEHEDFIRLTFLARVAKMFIKIDTMEEELKDYDDWTVDDILSSEFYMKRGLYAGYDISKKIDSDNAGDWKDLLKKEQATPIHKMKTFSIVFTIIAIIATIAFGVLVYLNYFTLPAAVITTSLCLEAAGLFVVNLIPSVLKKKFSLI